MYSLVAFYSKPLHVDVAQVSEDVSHVAYEHATPFIEFYGLANAHSVRLRS